MLWTKLARLSRFTCKPAVIAIFVTLTIASRDAWAFGEPSTIECTVDRTSISVGGCIVITLRGPMRDIAGCVVKLDDVAIVESVLEAGQTQRASDGTIVLLSHKLFSDTLSLEAVPGKSDAYRLAALFGKPGTIRLSAECNSGVVLDTMVRVTEAQQSIQPALDILYPELDRSREPTTEHASVVTLLVDDSYGVTPRSSRKELQELQTKLVTIKRHPDWAEIYEALIARLEARIEYFEQSDRVRVMSAGPDETIELPPLPDNIQRVLDAHFTSPFARAIQDSIRQTVKNRDMLRQPGKLPRGYFGK